MTVANKLPVWKTVSTAWRLPVIHWHALIRIVWLPLIVLLAFGLAIELASVNDPALAGSLSSAEEWKPINPEAETPEGYTRSTDSGGYEFIAELPERTAEQHKPQIVSIANSGILLELLRLALIVPVMVAWHFAVWPPPDSDRGTGIMPLKLGMRELRYLGFGLLLCVATAVFHLWSYSLIYTAIMSFSTRESIFWVLFGQFFWLAIASYPALRLSPVLALNARGDGGSLDKIWRMTRGNGWRLVAVFTLTSLPLAFFAMIARFNAGFFGLGTSLLFELGSVLLLLAFGIITASWLSLAAYTLQMEDTEETASDQVSDPDAKLPVWQTISDAFAFLFENRGFAIRYGWIAAAATYFLGLLIDLMPDWGLAGQALVGFVYLAALVPIIAVVIVPWHRMILLRETPGGIQLGNREKHYILLAIQLSALYWVFAWVSYAPTIAADMLGSSGSVLTLTSLFYILSGFVVLIGFCLFSPILPAVAVGRYSGFKDAFELSRDNRLSFVVVNFAVLTPSFLFVWLLPNALFEGNWAYVGNLIHSIVYVFDGFVGATALSLCYHRMGGMQGETEPEPPKASP